jgi:hypothetical protein
MAPQLQVVALVVSDLVARLIIYLTEEQEELELQ